MSDKKFVIESNFEHKGFRCVVVFNGCTGSRCGYVEIPADHPIAGKGWGRTQRDRYARRLYLRKQRSF